MLLTHLKQPGITRDRRRRDVLGRRQTLGHNLLDGLVEWWPLNEQSDLRRGVHAGLHLSDNNTVTGADGVDALASQFTSANVEYLSRTSEAALQVGDYDFCFTARVYADTFPASGARIISKRANGTTSHEYDFFVTGGGAVSFELRTAAGVAFGGIATGTLATATWYRLWAWHDAAADQTGVQIDDGTPVTAATSGNVPTTNTSTFMIGELQQVSRPWNGRIHRVGFWKGRIPTSDERAYLFNSRRDRNYPFV